MDPTTPTVVCRACGTVLSSQGSGIGQLCLACLLEPALADHALPPDDTPITTAAGSLDIVGSRFAHYEIAAGTDGSPVELGRGAMGVTYRAFDTTLRCAVALKVVVPEIARNPSARARFLREARAAAGLRHPHVASVFYFAERPEDGQPFYAMELVEGETLHVRVQRAGGLPVADVLAIGEQTADALAAAEARGLTHRDLKPANLMLVAGPAINVKIIDFGLAKSAVDEANLTLDHHFVGTPAFASPEHFNVWQDTDARSDFYALGATLWYALTSRTPFVGRTLAEIHGHQARSDLPLHQLRAANVPPPMVELLRSLLSSDPAGRPQTAGELAAALARCKEHLAGGPPGALRRTRAAAFGALLLVMAGMAWAVFAHQHRVVVPPPASGLAKSIAVLPFENKSADKGDTSFANGVQDEILTDLAGIADLKVISRHSVLGYADPAKRPPAHEIGRALDVAYLLEGSVQRDGDRVRLAVELIDAARDRQVWAETFDRNAADVFALQSEVTNTISGKLQASLSGPEKAALNEPPTHDLAAYELYLHAKELMYNFEPNTSKWEPLFEAARLLDEATARDPDFFDAWVLLTAAHGNLLWFNADPTPTARMTLAEEALAHVRRLRPDAGETHLSASAYYYHIHQPERGRPELDLARVSLPNDPQLLLLTGSAGMIDGRWAEALSAMEKARTLNPRHLRTLNLLSIIYEALRRYDDAKRVMEDAITAGLNPDYCAMRHAAIVQNQTGDTTEYRQIFQRQAGLGAPSERTVIVHWDIAMRARDFEEAARVVNADSRQAFTARTHTVYPRAYLLGGVAYARGDLAAARADYEKARPVFEEAVRLRPDDASAWMYLADLDARLGRKGDAVREGTRSVTLLPISQDASEGARLAESLGWIYAVIGEKEHGLAYLESLENVPAAYDYGFLSTHPDFDVFRGEPRFQALLQAIRRPVDLTRFNPADFRPPPSSAAP